MGNIFNNDFREFILCLNKHEVDYILVGGYSVILHGYPRTTGDLDVWVNPIKENYNKLMVAFQEFGLPNIPSDAFFDLIQYDVFGFGRPPVSIEILRNVKGLIFEEAKKDIVIFEENDFKVKTISYHHLIEAKKSSNRPRDINDIENLEK
jgi:hypothetical protein